MIYNVSSTLSRAQSGFNMNSRKFSNKELYDIYKKLQFPKRTAMLLIDKN